MGWNFDRFFLCFLIEFGAIAFFFKKNEREDFRRAEQKAPNFFMQEKHGKMGGMFRRSGLGRRKLRGKLVFNLQIYYPPHCNYPPRN